MIEQMVNVIYQSVIKVEMNFKNKIMTHPNGNRYHILAGKPVDDSKRSVYLLDSSNKDADYSLWYFEKLNDQEFEMWPYNGNDNEELILELMDKFVQTAFDEC
jgi:hypothetical protein